MGYSVESFKLFDGDDSKWSLCFICVVDGVLNKLKVVIDSAFGDVGSLVDVNNERYDDFKFVSECFCEKFIIGVKESDWSLVVEFGLVFFFK